MYSLFLSIPLPYLFQPPPWLLPCFLGPASTHCCHQAGGLGDSLAPGDVLASLALTLPLDMLLFLSPSAGRDSLPLSPFSPVWELLQSQMLLVPSYTDWVKEL